MLATWSDRRSLPTSSRSPTSVVTPASSVIGAVPMSCGPASRLPAGVSSTPAWTTAWSRPGRPTSSGMARRSMVLSSPSRHGSTSPIPTRPPWWSWQSAMAPRQVRSCKPWPHTSRRPRRCCWWRHRTRPSRGQPTRSFTAWSRSARVTPCKPACAELRAASSSRSTPAGSLRAISSRRYSRRSRTTRSPSPGSRVSTRSIYGATSPPAPVTPRLCAPAAMPSDAVTRRCAARSTDACTWPAAWPPGGASPCETRARMPLRGAPWPWTYPSGAVPMSSSPTTTPAARGGTPTASPTPSDDAGGWPPSRK